ncbi:hypothetical protein U1Q18_015807 [Sarracenia purpurea var. burkii]
MYQQRRLGALGIEWRPSSVRFAVGADLSQMLPIVDLDLLIDPLPEFVDAMDWEPENEVQSDDTDSEYNVTEELSSGGEHGSLNSISSVDPECSSEDSGIEGTQTDALRRSKRRKQKAEVEIMTSSGRRVKRKILDECDGDALRNNRKWKSRHGRKKSRKKSSLLKSLRPQRAAARNALTLFSRITGVSTDGEEEEEEEEEVGSENSYDTESTLQDSNISSEESDKSLPYKHHKHSKGKEIFLDVSDCVVEPNESSESQTNVGNRRKLVLKFPIRDIKKPVPAGNTKLECDRNPDIVGSSSKSPQEANETNQNQGQIHDENCSRLVGSESELGEQTKVEHHLELSEGYNRKIKWGGFKVRTSKRLKMGEPSVLTAYAGSSSCHQGHAKIENIASGQTTPENEWGKLDSSSETQYHGAHTDEMVCLNQQHGENDTPEDLDGAWNDKEHFGCHEHQDYDKLPKQDKNPFDNTATTSRPWFVNHPELKQNPATPTKLRIRSKRVSKDDESPKSKVKSSMQDWRNGGSHALSESPDTKQSPDSEMPDYDGIVGPRTHGDQKDVASSVPRIDRTSRSVLLDSHKSKSHDKMYNAVYRRSKPSRDRSNAEGGSGGVGANTSDVNNHSLAGVDFPETPTNGVCHTRSMGLKVTIHDKNAVDCNIKSREDHDGSKDSSADVQKSSINACNERPYEEWRSGFSRVGVGLRSTRNRRSSYHFHDASLPDRMKLHQPGKNSWLMLSTHEEGSRYIPQLGDEVVYFRQGHHEYIDQSGVKEVGPWKTIKGNIRAVEFCQVTALEYLPFQGSGESSCRMTLQFVDSSSNVDGKSFTLRLREMSDFPDFLVERSRYDAAIQRNWTCRDKCRVWWRNEGDENGSWWEGRIVEVKPKSPEFPESPWERYVVRYKSDPTERLLHSPWELHDTETIWEPPHIDNEIREKMLCSFEELEESALEDQDRYGIRQLRQVLQKKKFMNRFPAPLSLEVIQSRLENNYYRSLEALKHDFSVMLSNAESCKTELLSKMRRLSDWFTRTLSSL